MNGHTVGGIVVIMFGAGALLFSVVAMWPRPSSGSSPVRAPAPYAPGGEPELSQGGSASSPEDDLLASGEGGGAEAGTPPSPPFCPDLDLIGPRAEFIGMPAPRDAA